MRISRIQAALVFAIFVGIGGAAAQTPAVAPPAAAPVEGSVIGRVVCSDTQGPARFAAVTLTPVAETAAGGDFEGMGRRASTRTDLDGQYAITGVSAGDYYVTASATGYISESAALQEGLNAGTDIQTLLAQLPVVHVSAGSSSTANVTLARGATIAGKVLWDDGSPATGVQVGAVPYVAPSPTQPTATQTPQAVRAFGGYGGGYGTTDDRGEYRLTGLPAGDYLVRATMPIPSPNGGRGGFGGDFGGASIAIYAPGKVRKTDARPLTLHTGEEHDDLGITLDLASLHTISGHVSSASDSVTLGSGTIRITDQTDTTLTRSASIAADGSFTLTYVPSGTYTLAVPYASSSSSTGYMGRGGRGGYARTSNFQPLTQTLSVTDTDVSGLAIALTPATGSSSQP